MLHTAPSMKPVDVGITKITSTSFKLEWSKPLHIYGTLLYYQITCIQNLNNVWISTTVNSSVDVSNLRPFTDYTCCISATSLDSRPIKIRPGTYCRGDSAHALVYSPESGESPFSFSHLFSIFVHQLSSLLRCSRRLLY